MKEPSDAEWKLVTDLLEHRYGLVFDTVRRAFLERRLASRIERLRLSSLSEYYRYLLLHPRRAAEDRFLRRIITNNESYFFRETRQIEVLMDDVLPALRASGRPVRVLSAGCASGEEPYTIAIALHAVLGTARWSVDGFDLNPDCVERGRAALFGASALRSCDALQRRRFFEREGIDRWRLLSKYRANVQLFEGNLVDDDAPGELYDAVFCRNVLIYFSPHSMQRAVSRLLDRLRPGGYLFLGHSESLINKRRDLRPVVFQRGIVYRNEAVPA